MASYVGLLSHCHVSRVIPSSLRQPFDGDQMFDRAKFGVAGHQDGLHLLRRATAKASA